MTEFLRRVRFIDMELYRLPDHKATCISTHAKIVDQAGEYPVMLTTEHDLSDVMAERAAGGHQFLKLALIRQFSCAIDCILDAMSKEPAP